MKNIENSKKIANKLEEAAKSLHKTVKYIKEVSFDNAHSITLKAFYSLCAGYQCDVQNDNFNGIF